MEQIFQYGLTLFVGVVACLLFAALLAIAMFVTLVVRRMIFRIRYGRLAKDGWDE